MGSTKNYYKIISENKSVTSSASNARVLRNGKILLPNKNPIAMKRRSTSMKTENNQFSFIEKSSSVMNSLQVKKKKKYENLMITTNFSTCLLAVIEKLPFSAGLSTLNTSSVDNLNNNCIRTVCLTNIKYNIESIKTQMSQDTVQEVETTPALTSTKGTESTDQLNLLAKLKFSRLNKSSVDTQNNDDGNLNNYRNLKDNIDGAHVSREHPQKIKTVSKAKTIKKTKSKCQSSNCKKEKYTLKTQMYDHSIISQDTDVRFTRSKKIKLQEENRKQLDKILLDKYCDKIIKTTFVQLDNITEKAKFLSKLGLTCRFKCPLSVLKKNCK